MHSAAQHAPLGAMTLLFALGAGVALAAVISCKGPSSPPELPATPAEGQVPQPRAVEDAPSAAPAAPSVGASVDASVGIDAGPPDVSAAASASAASATGPCPADMIDVELACIDRFEAPNEAGQKPLLMQNVAAAKAWCEARGKRLCTEDEWVRACKGPGGRMYPYGKKYQEHHCNQDAKYISPSWAKLGKWPADVARAEAARLDQSEPSGHRSTCASSEGVYDLTGNAGEWVVRTREHPEACQTPEQKAHQYVVMGCFWGKCFRAPHEPSCEYVNCAHDAGFRSYEFGARCCRDRRPGG